jgi:hypothetical protein
MNDAAHEPSNTPTETAENALRGLVRVLARATARGLLAADRSPAAVLIADPDTAGTGSRPGTPVDRSHDN